MTTSLALVAEAPTAALAYLLTYLPAVAVRRGLAFVAEHGAVAASDLIVSWNDALHEALGPGSLKDAFVLATQLLAAAVEAGWLRQDDSTVTLCPDAPGLAGWLPRTLRRSLRRPVAAPAPAPVEPPAPALPVLAPAPVVIAVPNAPDLPPLAKTRPTRMSRAARARVRKATGTDPADLPLFPETDPC